MRRTTIVRAALGIGSVCPPSWACKSARSPVEPSTVCSFAIAPASQAFTEAGGSGSVAVATTAGGPWSAASSVDWVAVTAGGTEPGPGPSPTPSGERSAGCADRRRDHQGQRHTVTQSGRPPIVCSFELDPRSVTIDKDVADGAFSVIQPATGLRMERDERRIVAGREPAARPRQGRAVWRTRSRAARASSRAMPASRRQQNIRRPSARRPRRAHGARRRLQRTADRLSRRPDVPDDAPDERRPRRSAGSPAKAPAGSAT